MHRNGKDGPKRFGKIRIHTDAICPGATHWRQTQTLRFAKG
jgi:hypothetical protein